MAFGPGLAGGGNEAAAEYGGSARGSMPPALASRVLGPMGPGAPGTSFQGLRYGPQAADFGDLSRGLAPNYTQTSQLGMSDSRIRPFMATTPAPARPAAPAAPIPGTYSYNPSYGGLGPDQQAIMNAIMQYYSGGAGRRYAANRAALMAEPGANDPSLFSYAGLQSDLGNQGEESSALTSARLGELNNVQDFAQKQFLMGLQGNIQKSLQPKQGVMDFLSPLLGSGLSSLLKNSGTTFSDIGSLFGLGGGAAAGAGAGAAGGALSADDLAALADLFGIVG